MIGQVESVGVPGWSLWCCSVIGGRLAGCSMVGLAETVEVLVCCVWQRIVDIHNSGMLIPLSKQHVYLIIALGGLPVGAEERVVPWNVTPVINPLMSTSVLVCLQ